MSAASVTATEVSAHTELVCSSVLGLLHAPDTNGGGPRPGLLFEGRDMVSLKESERTRIRARRMGFVFQSFHLVPSLNALENVLIDNMDEIVDAIAKDFGHRSAEESKILEIFPRMSRHMTGYNLVHPVDDDGEAGNE